MNYKKLKSNNAQNAERFDENDALTALYGQLTSIKKTIEGIALHRENGDTSANNGKFGFKLTKQEIKTMPESIRKIFIANNYIVNYRITSNGYYEARIRRKDMNIEASGRDFETMRKRFMTGFPPSISNRPSRPNRTPLRPFRRQKRYSLPITPRTG